MFTNPTFISSFKASILLVCIAVLVACTSSPHIHSLIDGTAQFDTYKTYAFHPNLNKSDPDYDRMSSRYIKLAIQNEMKARGFIKADDADLWVNFNVHTKDKISIDSSPSVSLYYGFRHGYGVWGDYPLMQERIRHYTEGTLNIDLIDKKTNLLLWEGVAIGKVSNRSYENLEVKVNEAVKLIFETLPKE